MAPFRHTGNAVTARKPARELPPPRTSGNGSAPKAPRHRSTATRWRGGRSSYLFVLPALLLFVVFVAWPVVRNIQLSFYGAAELATEFEFVGIENYRWLAQDRASRLAFRNVALFAAMTIPAQMGLGLILAIMLRGGGALRVTLRSLLFLPVVLTPVAISFLFADVFEASNGLLNSALRDVGLSAFTQAWLGDTRTALMAVAAVNVWMWTGFSMAIYQAAMEGIPGEVVEAASVDGASWWQSLRLIIVPLLRSAHYALLILGVIGTLKTFDLVYVLTGGGPDNASEVPTTLLLRTLLAGRDGRASAIGTGVFVLALIVTGVQLRMYSRKQDAR